MDGIRAVDDTPLVRDADDFTLLRIETHPPFVFPCAGGLSLAVVFDGHPLTWWLYIGGNHEQIAVQWNWLWMASHWYRPEKVAVLALFLGVHPMLRMLVLSSLRTRIFAGFCSLGSLGSRQVCSLALHNGLVWWLVCDGRPCGMLIEVK